MKIYTKTGDGGETGLYGGSRVSKDHPRIRVYGTLDEANACLGVAAFELGGSPIRERLLRVQAELFQLGAELASPDGARLAGKKLVEGDVDRLEKEIDAMEEALAPLRSFVLPGGSRAAAALHLARAVLRRAEREAVALARDLAAVDALRPEVVRYLNRLSDWLFVSAREANREAGIAEVEWKGR